MEDDVRSPVAQLVLARLLVKGDKGDTVASIRKDLEPLLGHVWSGSDLTAQLEGALHALVSEGRATRTRPKKTELFTITPQGASESLASFGLRALPPKTTWSTLKKNYLPALALGLPGPSPEEAKRLGGETGIKAALLHARFGVPIPPYSTAKADKLLAAYCWKLLGIDSGANFTAGAVQEALLRRELGEPPMPEPGPERKPKSKSKPKPSTFLAGLLAREVGARKSTAGELHLATVRQWIERTATPVPPAPERLDDHEFARRVVAAARSCPTGRYGENKVFVAHVWRRLRESDPDFAAMPLDEFKNRLADANHARLLDLSRADLVQAMDPQDVEQSEIRYLGASFHFVRI
jgi:hypothetical protein